MKVKIPQFLWILVITTTLFASCSEPAPKGPTNEQIKQQRQKLLKEALKKNQGKGFERKSIESPDLEVTGTLKRVPRNQMK